jgi:hypothetical protein
LKEILDFSDIIYFINEKTYFMPIKLTTTPLYGATPKVIIQEMATAYQGALKKWGDSEIKRKYPNRKCQEQSSCAWISVEELLKLIVQNRATGIRIYFGQHTKSSTPLTNEKEYEDLLSVIFVATRNPSNPDVEASLNDQDQLKESDIDDETSSVILTGQYEGNGADKIPICNPECPTPLLNAMKIIIR